MSDPATLFRSLDTNGDGALTAPEFQKIGPSLGVTTAPQNPAGGNAAAAKDADKKKDDADKGTNLPDVGSGGSSSGSRETGPSR